MTWVARQNVSIWLLIVNNGFIFDQGTIYVNVSVVAVVEETR